MLGQDVRFPGAEVLGRCEFPKVGIENRTQVRRAENIVNQWSISQAQQRKGFMMIASSDHRHPSTEFQLEFCLAGYLQNN